MATRKLNDEGREDWGGFELGFAGTTHVGRIRKTNQDAFDRFDDPDRGEILLVVADGMGGHRGGEIASRMAVGTLGKLWRVGEEDPADRLTQAIARANLEIHKLAGRDTMLRGMGTTVVALLLCQSGPSYAAHVGDSRLYRLRDDSFCPLTEDHSLVAQLVRDGSISPAEARSHPRRNQITRSLGARSDVDVGIAPLELRSGDSFLLCSDGLYSMLPDEDLATLARRSKDPHAVVAWMIDAANQAGGMDNVTAVVAQLHEAAGEAP